MNGSLFHKLYCKMSDDFCLNTGKNFLLEVLLKTNRKTLFSSKKGARDF